MQLNQCNGGQLQQEHDGFALAGQEHGQMQQEQSGGGQLQQQHIIIFFKSEHAVAGRSAVSVNGQELAEGGQGEVGRVFYVKTLAYYNT